MSRLNTVVNFLNEINSKSTKDAFGSLLTLIEDLENKNDPEPVEIEIVDVAYQLIEKLNLLESAMRKYSSMEHVLTGDKLDNLYEHNHKSGSSTLFDS